MLFGNLFKKKKTVKSTPTVSNCLISDAAGWDRLSTEEKTNLIQWAVPVTQQFGIVAENANRMFESKEILNDSYESIRLALCITGIYMLIKKDSKMFDNCMTGVVVLSNFVNATKEEIDSLTINKMDLSSIGEDVKQLAEDIVKDESLFERLQKQQSAQADENIAFVNSFFGKEIIKI